jgi:hypothetical protein
MLQKRRFASGREDFLVQQQSNQIENLSSNGRPPVA